MRNKMIIIFILFSSFNFEHAYAQSEGRLSGAFVEPMITYESGSGEINFPSPINNSNSDVDGFGIGARVGAQVWRSAFAGIDARYSLPNFKDSTLNQDVNSQLWTVGPMIGFQMPTLIGLRMWASWIIAGQLDPDKDKGVDEVFKEANGIRFGGGIRIGLVSLNLEYQDIKFDKTEIQEVGVFNPGYSTNNRPLNNESIIMSVSLPIGI